MRGRILILLGLVAVILTAIAQILPGQAVQKQIKFPEYDRTTGKIKSLLTGEKAIPQKNGYILVEEAKLETYVYDGAIKNIDLIIHTPKCLFNFTTRVASSAEDMTVRRADGQAMIEGRGFAWDQRNGTLVISNAVKSVMENGFMPTIRNVKNR